MTPGSWPPEPLDLGPFRFGRRPGMAPADVARLRERLRARLEAIVQRLGPLPPDRIPKAADVRRDFDRRFRELGLRSVR